MASIDNWRQTASVMLQTGKGTKGGSGRKGYRNKSHQLELIVREKNNFLTKLQSEKLFLKQKGAVLELLLEVASEVAVHKRQHTGTKFPELRDTQLLEFLEKFLDSYGGYAAERPTARNYFQLERLDVDKHRDVQRSSFLEKYTSLVQRLSLLLLQATDDSMKGGLTTTIEDLKELLLGTLLWSPLTLMQVSTHHLVTGEPIVPDPEHSAGCITGIQLSPEQEDVLVIIGDLYNSQVTSLEATHSSLCQQLDADMQESTSSTLAATIMRVDSNMHRLLAIHQLFHVAIMHNLLDQQLAHLCVRCFPRFPCMQDLLNALAHIRDKRGKGLDVTEAADGSGRSIALPGASAYLADKKALQKPNSIEPSFFHKGRSSDSGKPLLPGSGLFNSSTAASLGLMKEETKSGGDTEQVSDPAAAAAAEQIAPKSPLADVMCSPTKDWEVQSVTAPEEPGSSTPQRPGSSSVAPPSSSHKRPRSPVPAGKDRVSGVSSKVSKRLGVGTTVAVAYTSSTSQAQKRNKSGGEEVWPKQQQLQQSTKDDGMGDLAAVAAAAAAGMPLDPAAAAALPVPIDILPAHQRPSSNGQQAELPPNLVQQLASMLNPGGGPIDLMQLVTMQPKLSQSVQQQPHLLGMLQEAIAQQQEQQHNEQHEGWQQQQQGFPDGPQAVHGGPGTAAMYAGLGSQQQGLGKPSRCDSMQQQQHTQWPPAAGASSGVPALEVLPPSLTAKESAGTSPLQALLQHVAALLQACSNVSESATAAMDAGQEDYVSTAVSAAEAALSTALKSLQDIKRRCSRPYTTPGASSAPAGPAYGPGLSGLPGAGPSATRLHPPAGIPMPGPAASQAVLPQSLSLALTSLNSAEAQPPQSNSALLAGMGGQGSRNSLHNRNGPAGYNSSQAPGGSSAKGAQLSQEQQHLASSLAQQLPSLQTPAAVSQLVQYLQQQHPGVDMSSMLVQMVGAAGQGAAPDLASLVAFLQQPGQGGAAVPPPPPVPPAHVTNASTAPNGWPAAEKKEDLPPAYDAAAYQAAFSAEPVETYSDRYNAAGAGRAASQPRAATGSEGAAAGTGPAAANAAAAMPSTGSGAAPRAGANVKEESPSAGSSTTITGQSGRQQNGPDSAADQSSLPLQQEQQRFDQQQLEGLARAAAAAMSSQLQGPGQTEAFISTVMHLLQGQGGVDMSHAGVTAAMSGLLSAINGPTEQGQGAAAAVERPVMGQSPAAAATMLPPAAAAAMLAKQAAAAAPPAAAQAGVPQAAVGLSQEEAAAGAEFGEGEVDAVSALEMLAAAAVHSQQHEAPAPRRRAVNRDR